MAVARIWDGSDVAHAIVQRVREAVSALRQAGHPPPTLAQIRVSDAPALERMQRLQAEACRASGIAYQLRSFSLADDQRTIAQALAELNAEPSITGIIIHAPTWTQVRELAAAMAPEKDVDGVHPLNLGRLLTDKHRPRAVRGAEVVHLLKHAGIPLVGAHVICVGNASGLAGRFAFLCLQENATVTAWRHADGWPAALLQRGDVLLIDTEAAPAVDGSALKPGGVVIDTRAETQRSPLCEAALAGASLCIPMPGGVGPATIAMRLSSLVERYRAQVGGKSGC
jgi:methylenetetrahydrofolate dehydrogenase (NADP+)/methenyltetrahydrofolate cyclohydrolase